VSLSPFFVADFHPCTKPRKRQVEQRGCLGIFVSLREKWDRRHEWEIVGIEPSPFEFRWNVSGQCVHCGIRAKHSMASEAEMLAEGIAIPEGDKNA
jgi:hypothetical protein